MSPRETGNPFSTRWTRPGAIPYVFANGQNCSQLVDALRENGWRGAIVGPHGSGKSTLLATLRPAIEQAGRAVRAIALRDGQRKLPADFLLPRRAGASGVIIVDGFEQLGWFARRRLLGACRRSRWGLLVTAHNAARASGLPLIYTTAPKLATVEHLVDRLQQGRDKRIRPSDVAQAFEQYGSNVREVFFSLYDVYESRRNASNASSGDR